MISLFTETIVRGIVLFMDILKSKIELAPNILESNNLNLITCSVGI